MNSEHGAQYSPDGRWLWDGQQWVAVQQPAALAGRPSRRNRLILGFVIVAIIGIVAVVAVVVPGRPGPGLGSDHTVTGTVTVFDTNGFDDFGAGCQGRNGYGDMEMGAQVTVTNETGTVLGTSSLGQGERDGHHCTFPFKVARLPDAKFYGIEIAHRGKVTYSPADLTGRDWKVELNLGS